MSWSIPRLMSFSLLTFRIQEQFPLIQRQWEAISHFRSQIIHRATLSLRTHEKSPEVRFLMSCELSSHVLNLGHLRNYSDSPYPRVKTFDRHPDDVSLPKNADYAYTSFKKLNYHGNRNPQWRSYDTDERSSPGGFQAGSV